MALTNRYEDDDAYHLPEGMKRVGYDEETERYTFRHGDELWVGEPGSFYGGKMKWVGYAPDVDHSSDESSSDKADDYDTDSCSESSNKGDTLKRSTPTSVKVVKTPRNPSQESDNDWGVPVASISATDAKPPDTSMKRRATQLRKAAASTITAIRVTRRWNTRQLSSGQTYQEKENAEGNDREKETGTDIGEKGLPGLPTE